MLSVLGVLVAAFVVVSALAALLGAANLGTALTFGQIAVVVAAAAVIIRR
jgi:hypothetical protein